MQRWLLVAALGAALAACGPGDGPTTDAGDGGRDVVGADTRDGASPDVPTIDTPAPDAPAPDAPLVDTPAVDAPAMDARGTDAPSGDTPLVDTPVIDTVMVDTSRPDAPPPDVTPPDATPADAPLDVVVRDVPSDGARGTSPLFGRCTADLDCRDATGACLTGYPGGLCSRTCTVDRDCGITGYCYMSTCLPACSLGGGECSTSTACFIIDPTDSTVRACFPSCWTSPPAGTLACNAGLTCDEYASGCATTLRTGLDNGQPCAMASDCRGGRCITETNMGAPTGWLGGYCYSTARVPVATAYDGGVPLPRSNCPSGTVAIPVETGADEGDVAICLHACTSDPDCRVGYQCVRPDFGATGASTNGYCAPINCLDVGRSCPVGYVCRDATGDAGGPRTGVCSR